MAGFILGPNPATLRSWERFAGAQIGRAANLDGQRNLAQPRRKSRLVPRRAEPLPAVRAEIVDEDRARFAHLLSAILSGISSDDPISEFRLLLNIIKRFELQLQDFVETYSKTKAGPVTAHSVRSLHDRLDREFNRIEDAANNPIDASNTGRQNQGVDIEKGLDDLLNSSGVKSKRVRGRLARAFADIAVRAAKGENVEETVAEIMRVTEAAEIPPLPDRAPRLYAERPDKSEDIIAFLRDPNGWGPWTSVGALSRVDLGRYDQSALNALNKWLRDNGKKLPVGLDIPTKSQVLDRLMESGSIPAVLAPKVGQAVAKRLRRAARHKKLG